MSTTIFNNFNADATLVGSNPVDLDAANKEKISLLFAEVAGGEHTDFEAYLLNKLATVIHFIKKNVTAGAEPGKVAIYKLMYFADKKHFQETGKTITGLAYSPFDKGPVPEYLYHEKNSKIKHRRAEKSKSILTVDAKVDELLLTKREKRILADVAKSLGGKTTIALSALSHDKTWTSARELNKPLDFLDEFSDACLSEAAMEYFAYNYALS